MSCHVYSLTLSLDETNYKMNDRMNDLFFDKGDVYQDWITKWRKWKYSWCHDTDPLHEFYIRFICKRRGKYTPQDHAAFASALSDKMNIKSSTVDRDGRITLRTGSAIEKGVQMLDQDNFSIVTIKLDFCTRCDVLLVALILESLGHGVIHDQGRVVSIDSSGDEQSPRMMPVRDDPIWNIIRDRDL